MIRVDSERLQDFYNFLLDSASDPLSLASTKETARKWIMKTYTTYLSSKASSSDGDISSLMNGPIRNKLKIIPRNVRYSLLPLQLIQKQLVHSIQLGKDWCNKLFVVLSTAGETSLVWSLAIFLMTS